MTYSDYKLFYFLRQYAANCMILIMEDLVANGHRHVS